jgi:hypothetical protein
MGKTNTNTDTNTNRCDLSHNTNKSIMTGEARIDTKTSSFRNSLARCVQQVKHDPEAIFELRWSHAMHLENRGVQFLSVTSARRGVA